MPLDAACTVHVGALAESTMSSDEPILSPEELMALASPPLYESASFVPLDDPLQNGSIASYDLTSQDRPVRGHLPALDLLHVSLAEHLQSMLSRALGTGVQVRSEDSQLTKLGACLSFIPTPACIGVLDLQPLAEPALLVLDPALVLALMTRFYGGSDPAGSGLGIGDRPLTSLERSFGRYLCERFGECMRVAWEGVAPVSMAVRSIELSPRFAAIAPTGDIVVTANFEVTAGEVTGQVQFVVPYASLRPYHRILHSSVRHGESQRVRSWQEQIEDHVGEVEVVLMAELGTTTLSMARLSQIREGFVLRLHTDRESPLVIHVEGHAKLYGKLTVENGTIAIRVEGWLSPGAAPQKRQELAA